jgi:hypothetical protein
VQQVLQVHEVNHVLCLLVGEAVDDKPIDNYGLSGEHVDHGPVAVPVVFLKVVPHGLHAAILARPQNVLKRFLMSDLCGTKRDHDALKKNIPASCAAAMKALRA